MGEKLEHANPDAYTKDLKNALDEFEEALLWRYEADLDDLALIWTTHGYEPTLEDSSDVNEGREQFEAAKKSAPAWAAECREWVSEAIADYSTQDLDKLESAFEDLRSAAKLLGETEKPDGQGTIFDLANAINGKCDFSWAGASGEAFRENFGDSAIPTMSNQEKIATSLANLYAARTCIIESVRRNTINALKRAADRLRETEDSGDETWTWVIVGVVSIPVGLAVPPVAGAVISAGGLIASTLDSADPDQKSSNDIDEIVDTLVRHLCRAGGSSEEGELSDKVIELQIYIKGVKSKSWSFTTSREATTVLLRLRVDSVFR